MEKVDVFHARGESRALLVFIHGGYWRSLDKRDFSFLAPPFTTRGVTVALTNYALCPAVTVEEIVRQQLAALAWLYRTGAQRFGASRERIFIAGHSAGGHLVAMMLAALWPTYAPDLPRKVVQGGLSVSGVYDLRELVHVPSVNDDVRLTPAVAEKLSPILYPPATDAPIYTAVGDRELPPFIAQNAEIGRRWSHVLADDIACPGDNHFTVIDHLADPRNGLFTGAMRMMGL
jgi:arylformamidase